MKSLISRIVCLSLALSVLCGSVGMATARHICLITGKEMKPLAKEKEDACCKKKKTAENKKAAFKKKCCELSVSHYKVTAETGNASASVKLPVLFVLPIIRFVPEWIFSHNPRKLFAAGFNKAPPLAGRKLLAFLHILRI